MNSYTLKKISGVPDWNTIPTLNIDIPYRHETDVQAWAQLCWDDAGIHVHLHAKETNIRCEEMDPLAEVCCDSCLEFFFRPTESMRYFNIEYNPACNVYLGYGSNLENLVRLILEPEKTSFHPNAYRSDDGWGITYHVPFAFIQQFFPEFTPYEGLQFYGNCYKCGDYTDHPHYLSWNKIDLPKLTFHSPQFFGRMTLGGENL